MIDFKLESINDFDIAKIKRLTYEDLPKITNGKKTVIFGCPLNIEEVLASKEMENINISYIVDNDEKKHGTTFGGYAVHPVSRLEDENKDNIIIVVAISFCYMMQVAEQLKPIGITNICSLKSMEARKNEKLGIKKPFKIIESFDEARIKSLADVRMFLTKDLTGYGIEFGAGSLPIALPEGCCVEYADCFSHNDGEFYTSWHSENFEVPVTYKTSIDEMEGIPDDSLDFILSSHVMEHTPNPFAALEKGYYKLKKGGKMICIIPNMLAWDDRVRELTTIEHLDKDYSEPCRERDFIHYAESYIKYGVVPRDCLYDTIKKDYEDRSDLHYHTFTYESFGDAVRYFCENYYKFSEIVSYPSLKVSNNAEFFYVLVK